MGSVATASSILLKECLGVTAKEKVLIVCDQGTLVVAQPVLSAAYETGAEAVLVQMPVMERHGMEPPDMVAAAMLQGDVAICCTSKSLTHTEARKKATAKGVRVASMPGITVEMLERGLATDYSQIAEKSTKLAQDLSKGRKITITGKNGTKLTAVIDGREGLADTGILSQPGSFGNLPAGEAYIAPIEGTAEGTIVCDGSIAQLGCIEEEPVIIEVKEGKLVSASGQEKAAELLRLLDSAGELGRGVAEIGIGTNPAARISGNILEDEKVSGTVHVAFGDSSGIGGKIKVPVHIDCVLKDVEAVIE